LFSAGHDCISFGALTFVDKIARRRCTHSPTERQLAKNFISSPREIRTRGALRLRLQVLLSWLSVKWRSDVLRLSIPPFGRGFSKHGVFRCDGDWAAQE
jgi:hypothetical protein